jgi:hypothetical protein
VTVFIFSDSMAGKVDDNERINRIRVIAELDQFLELSPDVSARGSLIGQQYHVVGDEAVILQEPGEILRVLRGQFEIAKVLVPEHLSVLGVLAVLVDAYAYDERISRALK